MDIDVELDATGLSCPMPIMKLSKSVKSMEVGQVIKMISSDPGSEEDVPKWVKRSKNELLESNNDAGSYIFVIKKLK